MFRTCVAVVVVGSSILSATAARADEPVSQGMADSGLIVGLERVVSFVNYTAVTASPQNGGGQSATVSVTSLAFLSSDPGGAGDGLPITPRLAVDGVIGTSHVTLGGAAWIWGDISSSFSNGGTSTDRPKRTFGGIAPRVGYLLPMTDAWTFWPRAGVEYATLSSAGTTSTTGGGTTITSGVSLNQLAADIEANVVYSPYRHIGFDLEIYGAIPITGSASVDTGTGTSTNENIGMLAVGLTMGMVGYF